MGDFDLPIMLSLEHPQSASALQSAVNLSGCSPESRRERKKE